MLLLPLKAVQLSSLTLCSVLPCCLWEEQAPTSSLHWQAGFAQGDTIIIFFPQAAWPHLADAGVSDGRAEAPSMSTSGPAVKLQQVARRLCANRATLIGNHCCSFLPAVGEALCTAAQGTGAF